MNPLEEQLMESLRRKDPLPGFEERVLSRIATQTATHSGFWRRLRLGLGVPRLRLATAGLVGVLLISIGVVGYYHEKRAQAEVEAAKSQVMLALRIASHRLNHAQKAVLERINQPPSGD